MVYSYQLVLKALEVLKQQLSKAKSDLNTLEILKNEALSEPFEFIINLKKVFFFKQLYPLYIYSYCVCSQKLEYPSFKK